MNTQINKYHKIFNYDNEIEIEQLIIISILPNVLLYNKESIFLQIKENILCIKENTSHEFHKNIEDIYVMEELDIILKELNFEYGIRDYNSIKDYKKMVSVSGIIYNAMEGVFYLGKFLKKYVNESTITKHSHIYGFKINKILNKPISIVLIEDNLIKASQRYNKKYGYIKFKKIKEEDMIVMAAIDFSKKHNEKSVMSFLEWAVNTYAKNIKSLIKYPSFFTSNEMSAYFRKQENEKIITNNEINELRKKVLESYQSKKNEITQFGQIEKRSFNSSILITSLIQNMEEDQKYMEDLNSHINYGIGLFDKEYDKKLTVDENLEKLRKKREDLKEKYKNK